MKRNLYLLALVALSLGYSCNNYLDVNPDRRTTIDTKEAMLEMLVSAYPAMQYYAICEIMSDNVSERNTTPSTTRRVFNEEMYTWDEGFQSGTDQDTPPYVWNACYRAIAAANQVLDAIEQSHDKEQFSSQRGEALVCRAYAHFVLVNIWALHYDPATADRLPGVPYNDEPEKVAIKYYTRNTIAEVYQMIEKDLTEGLPLLNDNNYTVPKYHFTTAAANAFAARFYLFKGEWDKVIEHANHILDGINIADRLLNLPGKEMYDAASSAYRRSYRRFDQPNVLLVIGSSSFWGRDNATSGYVRFGMTNEHTTLFSGNTVTGQPATYYKRWYSGSSYTLYKIYEHFRYSSPGSTSGMPFVMGAYFTMEEVLLSRAEAYAMKGDLPKALTDVDILISKRVYTGRTATIDGNPNPPPPPVTLAQVKSYYDNKPNFPDLDPFYVNTISEDQMSVLKHIIHWRRLEFFQEGLRWFDVKRFRLEVVHTFPYTGRPDIVLTKEDPRRALQITQEAQAFGIEANPR